MIVRKDYPMSTPTDPAALDDPFHRWVRNGADDPTATCSPPFGPPHVRAVRLLTGQRTWWMTRHGQWMRVVAMEPSHRRALLAGLRRHADTWQIEHAMHPETPTGSVPGPAAEWLEAQPLTAMLAALVAADTVEEVSAP